MCSSYPFCIAVGSYVNAMPVWKRERQREKFSFIISNEKTTLLFSFPLMLFLYMYFIPVTIDVH